MKKSLLISVVVDEVDICTKKGKYLPLYYIWEQNALNWKRQLQNSMRNKGSKVTFNSEK